MNKEDSKSQPIGKDVGNVTKDDLAKGSKKPKVKAVLFVPEGTSATETDLDIQIVSIEASGLNAIAMRRC
jgi:hypothetical protein